MDNLEGDKVSPSFDRGGHARRRGVRHRQARYMSLHSCADSIEGLAAGLRFQIYDRGKSRHSLFESCSHLPLHRYIFSTMVQSKSTDHASNGPFPVPPPYPWVNAFEGTSRRGLTRHRHRQASRFLVNIICCSISHVRLGYACAAPEEGKVGAPVGISQQTVVDAAWRRVRSMCRRLTKGGARGAGLERLLGEVGNLGSELCAVDSIPYSRLRAQDTQSGFVLEKGPSKRNGLASRPGPLVSDRIDFPEELQDFRGDPFISARSVVCLNDPDAFLIPDEEVAEDNELPIGGLADPEELFKLGARWDRVGRVMLYRQSEIDTRDIADCFPVLKEGGNFPAPGIDRQIIDRRRRNMRERRLITGSRICHTLSS